MNTNNSTTVLYCTEVRVGDGATSENGGRVCVCVCVRAWAMRCWGLSGRPGGEHAAPWPTTRLRMRALRLTSVGGIQKPSPSIAPPVSSLTGPSRCRRSAARRRRRSACVRLHPSPPSLLIISCPFSSPHVVTVHVEISECFFFGPAFARLYFSLFSPTYFGFRQTCLPIAP